MSDWLGTIGLPEVIAGILMLALNAYVLTGGADYGGGVWDLLASGPRRADQRARGAAHRLRPLLLLARVRMAHGVLPAELGDLVVDQRLQAGLERLGRFLQGDARQDAASGSEGRMAVRSPSSTTDAFHRCP